MGILTCVTKTLHTHASYLIETMDLISQFISSLPQNSLSQYLLFILQFFYVKKIRVFLLNKKLN